MFSLCCRSVRVSGLNPIYSGRLTSRQLPLHGHQRSVTFADKKFQSTGERLKYLTSKGFRGLNGVRRESTIPPDFAVARTQLLESLKSIKLSDTKNAPPPIFWSGVAGLVPIVVPPLSFLIFGYSHSLATLQMTFAATISAFLSGTKYGTLVSKECSAQWPNVLSSILPQFVSFTALLLPQMIGFPLITASIALNAFIDLTSPAYSSWFKALRLALSVPVLLALIITCILRMFH